ncbi:uncharacterized protein LOC133326828 [Musca vetustissima]|uniref:uncharacterized protein LOC133326828 n=1 Tax=Musca vetustissima TaxID=27455 RepID=UPI002AB61473|nr:uncharacterized protein LOC133326828 [Musca vetustissima]
MAIKYTKKPLAQIFRDGNSRSRFVNELKDHEEKVFNCSFDTAQSSLSKKVNLKQTQICVRRSLKRPHDSFTTADKLETKTELFLMPMPTKIKANNYATAKLNATVCGQMDEKSLIKNEHGETGSDVKPLDDPMDVPQRTMRVFVGNVDFVIKYCKLNPNINALWDVYGKLIKITKGKHRFEQSLLIRNMDGSGPILQCAYFDFNNFVDNLTLGSNIRVVGKLCGLNCLRTFRIDPCNRTINQSNFIRLQNVNSFVLLQNKNSNNN